ncbi:hypothetical protein [Pseudonocardia acaciae]|uniref:hypothetical protein n=1 Tax=Pseudonocardia acaciae TaxID=551276 RepID=UPI00048E7BF6|nr:hypothetical protein [Pseudonocardia acaciae]
MSGWRARLVGLLGGERLPEGFAGRLDAQERVLATATVSGGGPLVVSTYGLWLPEGRRVGWHLVSKATWGGGALSVIEAEESGEAGDAVLLRDLPPRRLPLAEPGAVPEVVHKRVTGSIRSRHRRELPGGGAWFVQRAVPGRDGMVLQVRPDPGADVDAVRRVAVEVARKLKEARG